MLFQVFFLILAFYSKYVCSSVRNIYFNGPLTQPIVLQSSSQPDTNIEATAHSSDPSLGVKDGHTYASNYGYDYTVSSNVNHPIHHGSTAFPHILQKGYTADTPEVATTKFEYSAIPNTQTYSGSGKDYYYEGENVEEINYRGYSPQNIGSYDNHGDFKYHGPFAITHILSNGHIADTPEVAAARAKHFEPVSEAKLLAHENEGNYVIEGQYPPAVIIQIYQNYGFSGNVGDQGPTSIPSVFHDGHIADNPEVPAAKAYQYAALSRGKAHEYESSGTLASAGDSNVKDGNGPFTQFVVWKTG